MDRSHVLAVVLLTAAITYLLRALPMAIFRRPFSNRRLAAFVDALPYALLSAMILPAIFYATGGGTAYPAPPPWESVAGAAVALALSLAGKSLPTVALAATAAAYLCGLLVR